MKQLPKIYKRTQTGATQQWEIVIKNNSFYTIEGQLNGKLTTSKSTIVFGKNIGKKNETSDSEQAYNEAKAKWTKKIERGYTEDINEIDTSKKFFEPMLAHKYKDYKDKISFPILVSPKIDGCRMVAQKNGLFTRNGKEYKSCPHISKILSPIFKEHPEWIIDGEVYSHDEKFEKIISLVKKSKPKAEDLIESEKYVKYWIFDGIIDNKLEGFNDRYKKIKDEIHNIVGWEKYIVFVENEVAKSQDEINKKHDEYIAQGYEGVMIRVPNSEYENKRSKNLLKLKYFLDEEFEIIDVVEGLGSRSGMAGKLMLKMDNGNTFGAGIRGGEEYYKELLKDKDKLIGKLATIRYQNLSEDGIPRFPIAVSIAPIDR